MRSVVHIFRRVVRLYGQRGGQGYFQHHRGLENCRPEPDQRLQGLLSGYSGGKKTGRDFLGTLNALRDYAKKNPSTRVEVRNTLYEIYGKMLYGSDKKEYLEAEGIGAMRKAAGLNDQTLLAELYIVMSELTSDEPLRSAIYDTKAIGLLQKKDREKDYYTPKNYFELADVFFRAEDWRDAIKYGSMYLENIPEDSAGNLLATRLSAMDMVGTSYMEISHQTPPWLQGSRKGHPENWG